MSVSHWLIEGIGIDANDIVPYIKTRKILQVFRDQFPEEAHLNRMLMTGNYSSFDMEEYLYGNGFENIADILCHCDDTDTLTFCDDGEGNSYFYYPPSMPWHHTKNEPQSEQEVIDRIVRAVQKIADMTRDQIEKIIDTDLYVVGFG